MDSKEAGAISSERDWPVIIEAQARSNQSVALYCREQGIPYSTFLYHCKKIQKRSNRSLTPLGSGRARGTAPRSFIPVQVEASGIRICFPGGLVMESEQLPTPGYLVEVARRWVGGEEVPW